MGPVDNHDVLTGEQEVAGAQVGVQQGLPGGVCGPGLFQVGSEVIGMPLSGASRIHSAVFPLNVAFGGGARVMPKYRPVVKLAK